MLLCMYASVCYSLGCFVLSLSACAHESPSTNNNNVNCINV